MLNIINMCMILDRYMAIDLKKMLNQLKMKIQSHIPMLKHMHWEFKFVLQTNLFIIFYCLYTMSIFLGEISPLGDKKGLRRP